MNFVPCSTCSRHVAATAPRCPFCAEMLPRRDARRMPANARTRAAVFAAGIALVGCAGRQRPAPVGEDNREERSYQNHPCTEPDPDEVARIRTELEQATDEDEKARLQSELVRAETPVCAPYGAPPARRRVV